MDVSKRLGAEFLGTFWLVLGGCGSAVLAAVFFTADKTSIGIGLVGVSLAFGLTVLTSAYAFGHVSGGHFNPAVTLGLVASGRFPVKDALPYIVVQVVGGLVASAVLWVVALSAKGMTSERLAAGGFASNGFADHSPGGSAWPVRSSSRSCSRRSSSSSSSAPPIGGPPARSPASPSGCA